METFTVEGKIREDARQECGAPHAPDRHGAGDAVRRKEGIGFARRERQAGGAAFCARKPATTHFHACKWRTALEEKAMMKDWQVDPAERRAAARGSAAHCDGRAHARTRAGAHIWRAAGREVQGGIFEMVTREVEIECLPADIPEEFKVDVSEMMIGKQLRAADLPLDPRKDQAADRSAARARARRDAEEGRRADAGSGGRGGGCAGRARSHQEGQEGRRGRSRRRGGSSEGREEGEEEVNPGRRRDRIWGARLGSRKCDRCALAELSI